MTEKTCKECGLYKTTFCDPEKCGPARKRFVDVKNPRWGHCGRCGGVLTMKKSTPYDWHLRVCYYTCVLCGRSFREYAEREEVEQSRANASAAVAHRGAG